ncbi:fas-binding factor 1-like isoform X2 [Plectropomus leopardus]|uniref:fas-binding factor 1-like isoform X2 n=1 Tax=Plectropomus leopardus TaxID=160734 RepID=UPI001C4C812F|nr:fas-binding factor 1-like isoform X2 [Plectropomus leopardus]
MATKLKGKSSKSLFGDDDLLDSLFDDEKFPVKGKGTRSGPLNRSSATDNIFSMLAEEVKRDGGESEDSDVSAADPNDILKNMKDMDDMDADLFASKKKPSSAPAQTKPFSNGGPKKDSSTFESKIKPEGADEPTTGGRKPNSAPPSTAHNYKKLIFSDSGGDDEGLGQTPHIKDPDDLLADLDDLLPDETKPEPKSSRQPAKPEKSAPSPSASPILKTETSKKRRDLTFDDDDKDDLMDALGFDSDKNTSKKKDSLLWSNKERSGTPQRPLTAVDGILESLTSSRLLERPPTGEKKDQPQSQEKQQKEKTSAVKESLFEDDLTFGSYQPTLGSTSEGRMSRRQSVRFSTEDVSPSTPEKRTKPATPSLRHRNSADWLGLKTNDDLTFLEGDTKENKTSSETPKAPGSPSLERRPSLTGSNATSAAKIAADNPAPTDKITKQTKPEVSKSQKREEEEDDWLAGALSRKKTLSVPKSDSKTSKQEDSLGLGEEVDVESILSKQVTSQAPRGREESLPSVKETSTFLGQPSPAAHSTPVRETRTKQDTIPTSPSTPPQSPSFIREHTPTTQPQLPSTLTSSSATAPRAKLDLGQTLHSSPPSDFPPQVTGPLSASAASVSLTQPQPQSPPHHLSSNKGSGVPIGPGQASTETMQQLSSLNPISAILPGSVWPAPQQNISTAVQQQVTLSGDSLQQLLLQQQMMQSQLLGLGGVVDTGVLQRLKDKEQPPDYQVLQARIIQLEGQVKTLQLERDQSQMLLECVQQRHKQDMELMENTHKTRVKLLEESAAQRETQARQECEDLMERLAAVTRSAEQERSELQAQYQRKLAQAQQDRDREVERLRELQRKSILEMKKDHEDHIERLKKLKEEEIYAVTSATSQTRSLKVVIEQMEQFSSRLGDLSSRVESTHEHTAHGLEEGARHRDEQLRRMQDRLTQQQKAMAEERAYLKEIISRMDTQLNEQQRQLEKERWKMTAEQAKAESTQRSLEGERNAFSMQISMEREELERAKSALLEEQKSVMQHCAEERRKLAAEWAHFHAMEKQRHERAEREVSSLLEKREGSIISLAQEQADLKLHTAELKQKEMAVAQERETLDRLREDVDREKERISSTAVRLKTRAQEVEAFSKLAAEKYEEGERALQEAKRVEAEHEARLRNIHAQTERLRQQEQRILQERMRLNHLQEDTERLRPVAPISSLPKTIPPILPDAGSVLPNPELTSTLNVTPTTFSANSQSMALQASLALWRYTAEKDREYLEEQQTFLENLKKKSYRSTFNTD